jgi:hypothetical protein
MRRGFDSNPLNQGLLLSLPMREGTGTATRDVAAPHHPVTLVATPTWTTVASGLQVLSFNAASHEYLSCPNASCLDLDFTGADEFSLGGWCYVDDMAASYAWIGRFVLDVSGWETFFFNYYLTLRISQGGADTAVSCYCEDVNPDVWMLMGISRSGAYPLFYRDGVAVESHYEVGGIPALVSSAGDLKIGNNTNGNAYNGDMWNPRIWNRALSATEWAEMFEQERHLFGV